jgi:hypothetical protein
MAKAYMGKGEYNNSYIAIIKVEAFPKNDNERARFFYIRALSLDQLSQPDAAYRDWNTLLSLPATAITEEMRKKAEERVNALRTATPLPATATSTRTPRVKNPTATRQPSKTPEPTATRMASNTPPGTTPISPTPSVTPTPTPK